MEESHYYTLIISLSCLISVFKLWSLSAGGRLIPVAYNGQSMGEKSVFRNRLRSISFLLQGLKITSWTDRLWHRIRSDISKEKTDQHVWCTLFPPLFLSLKLWLLVFRLLQSIIRHLKKIKKRRSNSHKCSDLSFIYWANTTFRMKVKVVNEILRIQLFGGSIWIVLPASFLTIVTLGYSYST